LILRVAFVPHPEKGPATSPHRFAAAVAPEYQPAHARIEPRMPVGGTEGDRRVRIAVVAFLTFDFLKCAVAIWTNHKLNYG
jgi:hypothetical protein